MTEITFKIERTPEDARVTIYENGIKRQEHRYHKETEEKVLIVQTAAEWYGVNVEV